MRGVGWSEGGAAVRLFAAGFEAGDGVHADVRSLAACLQVAEPDGAVRAAALLLGGVDVVCCLGAALAPRLQHHVVRGAAVAHTIGPQLGGVGAAGARAVAVGPRHVGAGAVAAHDGLECRHGAVAAAPLGHRAACGDIRQYAVRRRQRVEHRPARGLAAAVTRQQRGPEAARGVGQGAVGWRGCGALAGGEVAGGASGAADRLAACQRSAQLRLLAAGAISLNIGAIWAADPFVGPGDRLWSPGAACAAGCGRGGCSVDQQRAGALAADG